MLVWIIIIIIIIMVAAKSVDTKKVMDTGTVKLSL